MVCVRMRRKFKPAEYISTRVILEPCKPLGLAYDFMILLETKYIDLWKSFSHQSVL